MSFNTIGKGVPQIDAIEKATGRARFSGDLKLPNLLVGKVLHSPLAHARILRVDASRARALRGVKAVVTGADTPARKYGADVKDEYVLAVDKARYVGDEVAAVAAVDEDTAMEALSLIRVEYEELPPVLDVLEAMTPDAPLIHEAAARNIAVQYPVSRGDVERAFRQSECVIERRFVTSSVHPAYLEPLACVAEVDASGKVTVYAGSQAPFRVRDAIIEALNLPASKIRVVDAYCGGAFGGKMVDKPMVIGALLAQRAGRPVSIVQDRREAFTTAHGRAPMVVDIKMGASSDGTILAKQSRIVAGNGAYTRMGSRVLLGASIRVDSLYRFQNVDTRAMLVYTNSTPTGNFRGLGNPQAHFAVESMMDLLAEELGLDPVEIRLKNATQTGDFTAHGWKVHSCGLAECIRLAADRARWPEKRGREGKTGKRRTGIGIGCAIHISGTRSQGYAGSSALVKVDPDGTISVISGEADMGQGVPTAFAQIAAEELGARLEDVRIVPVDTDVSPSCLGSYASRVTHIGGNAVRLAAGDARQQLLSAAAERLEVAAADLDVRDGRVFVVGSPRRYITLAQAAHANLYRRNGEVTIGKGNFDSDSDILDGATKYGNQSGAYSFAAHVAEVEVDTETGQVEVVNFVAAHDVGRAINPMACEGQIDGAVAQGLGFALTEETLLDDKGVMVNPNFADYRVLTAIDVRPPSTILVETDDPIGPFGAKGVGEIGLIGTAPAIANAIYDAVGVRLTDLPFSPEKVLRALREH